jgi:dephospho-CoA kinase
MDKENAISERFIIGLTGNIGTGKSTVRKLLQHSGAYGIDADALTREALRNNESAIGHIRARFGDSIVNNHGAISNSKLAEVVFNDDSALSDLENIIHPLVTTAVQNLIPQSRLQIIVIEAIKLLESDLAGMCDSIWVVDADRETIFSRLVVERGMNRGQVMQRLSRQSSLEQKKKQADIIIDNSGNIEEIWRQVEKSWDSLRKNVVNFSSYVDSTSSMLAFLDGFLIKPASKEFQILEQEFTDDPHLTYCTSWTATQRKQSEHKFEWTADGLAKLISQYFVFIASNSIAVAGSSIWELSQFELRLFGFFTQERNQDLSFMDNQLEKIEHFGKLHRVRQISLPLISPIKERTSFYREEGYTEVRISGNEIPLLNKAGYNLICKEICEVEDIFSRPT